MSILGKASTGSSSDHGRKQTAWATKPQGIVQDGAGTARVEVTVTESVGRSDTETQCHQSTSRALQSPLWLRASSPG